MSRQHAVIESAASRETQARIWDAFRRWGYLQANLDPLGDLQPVELPELAVSGADADAARKIYCGTIGVEFMHIPDPERRRWIEERMESEAASISAADQKEFSIASSARKFSSKFFRPAISAPSAIRSKAKPRFFRFSTRFSMLRLGTTRSKLSWR